MPSKAESVLTALAVLIEAALPPGVMFGRGEPVPEALPPAGGAFLADGDPGPPEVLLSPTLYIYQHRAEVDIVVDRALVADPDAALDAIRTSIGTALASDRTLGGRCDWIEAVAPAHESFAVEGAAGLKAGTIGILLHYQTSDPLL